MSARRVVWPWIRPSRWRQRIASFLPLTPTQYRVTTGLRLTSAPSRGGRTLWVGTLWVTSKRRLYWAPDLFGVRRGIYIMPSSRTA